MFQMIIVIASPRGPVTPLSSVVSLGVAKADRPFKEMLGPRDVSVGDPRQFPLVFHRRQLQVVLTTFIDLYNTMGRTVRSTRHLAFRWC
jgi:hypothetical protein